MNAEIQEKLIRDKEWLLACPDREDICRENLAQIDHALEREKKGTYGICEICNKPIGWDVHEAYPQATTHLWCGLEHKLFPWVTSASP